MGGVLSAAMLLAVAVSLAFAGAAGAVAPEGDPPESMYSPSSIVVIDLTLPQSSIEALEAAPEEDYQPGTFSLASSDGTPGVVGTFSTPIEVGIRLKGGIGSFLPLGEKSAFKIKFASFVPKQKFLGLKKMTLNNMKQDASMLHENLAYRSFRAAGVPSSRSGYAWVRLNGEPLGMYLNVEDLDDVSLEKRFGPFDDPQHLYEGEHGIDVAPGEAGKFEVDEGDDEDIKDLEALIEAANDPLAPDWSERVALHADLEEMTRMWALEKYTGQWDGYAGDDRPEVPNNYFLYSDAAGKFQMLPWGTDQTWETLLAFDDPGGILFNECLADDSCAATYEAAGAEALATIPPLDLGKVAACTAELLAPWQELEDEDLRLHDAREIAEVVEETRENLASRPVELADWLGVEAPEVPAADAPCKEPEEPGKPGDGGPQAGASVAGPPAPPAGGLRLERVSFKHGALVARVAVALPGRLDLKGTTGPRRARTRICAADAPIAAGSRTVRCPLSAEAKRLRASHRLRVRLEARFAPSGAARESIVRSFTVPRSASSDRRR
ncbi:MAG TPA: CotH kinase family protein [Solirubrobacterales bacterium]|nr:CotH kinase family protein [Solirubrobacterales bacterium]